MSESSRSEASQLSQEEIDELTSELGIQLSPTQLQALLELVADFGDLDEAYEALEQISKAA